ncbi:hypothetical protein MKX01_002514 [Papaver californicum]|nr:hypothetical protein MKX01_002514 [Papaver californicum]
MEYENIQLTNDQEDVCHPIDDPRSPVSDTKEMGIEVYCEFVNNYFGRLNFGIFYIHKSIRKQVRSRVSRVVLIRMVQRENKLLFMMVKMHIHLQTRMVTVLSLILKVKV